MNPEKRKFINIIESPNALKIVHLVASPSPGGIESYVRDLAVAAAANNHGVHVCFLETARGAGTSVEYEKEYLSELASAGVRYAFIGRNARWMPWRGVTKIKQYVVDHSIDIYHSHLTYGIVFGMSVRVPRVYTHHSIDMRVSRVVFSFLNRMIEQLVGISNNCAHELSRYAGRDVATIFNGVNVNRLILKETAPRRVLEDIECILVGRLCREKNYELLIQGVSLLPESLRSRLTVRVAGAGSSRLTARLDRAISEAGLSNVIQLLGSRSDIPKLLASSGLFLMSSSSEGLPISLIEAAVSGLPCVVTDVGGCREIVEICANGIVVEPGDPQAFADAIRDMIRDVERFSKMSSNALTRSRVFSIEVATDLHISMYRTLLASNGGQVRT